VPSSSTTETGIAESMRLAAGLLAQALQFGGRLGDVQVHRIGLLDQRHLGRLGGDTSAPSVTSARPMRPEIGA
jgi:hypothetical protein